MCTAAASRKKYFKTLYFDGSKTFKVIDVDNAKSVLLQVLGMINSISVPICNRFHARRANSGTITTFRGIII